MWQESLPLGAHEQPVCLASDPVSQTFWVCTTSNVLEVLVRQEDRDVWRAKLEKADYTDALRYAKVSRLGPIRDARLQLICADETAEGYRPVSTSRCAV